MKDLCIYLINVLLHQDKDKTFKIGEPKKKWLTLFNLRD